MKYIPAALFSLLFLFSCRTDPKERFFHELTNDSAKYWDVLQNTQDKNWVNTLPVMSYRFGSDGSYDLYIHHKDGTRTKRVPSENDDVIETHRWEYRSPFDISIEDHPYFIEKLTEDTLIYINSTVKSDRRVFVKGD